jgi:hypothetical protein
MNPELAEYIALRPHPFALVALALCRALHLFALRAIAGDHRAELGVCLPLGVLVYAVLSADRIEPVVIASLEVDHMGTVLLVLALDYCLSFHGRSFHLMELLYHVTCHLSS